MSAATLAVGAPPRGRGTGDAAAWFGLTATLMAGLAPLLLTASTPLSDRSSPVWVGALVLVVLAGLRYAWLVGAGGHRLTELVFWLFIYVFLGLAPLVQMRSGTYPATTPRLDTSNNGIALAIAAAGTVAFALGLLAAGTRPAPGRGTPRALVRPHRVHLLALGSLLFLAYYVSQVGLGPLFGSRQEHTAADLANWPNSSVAAIVRAASTWPLLVSFVALLALRRQQGGRSLGRNALTAAVLVGLLIAVNPLGSPRYVFGTALLAVVLATAAATRPRRLRAIGVALAVGLVLVFPYADIARFSGQVGSTKEGGPTVTLTSGDFDALDQINNTVAYVDSEGHTLGRQVSGAGLFFVPRTVWADKPLDTGIVVGEFRGYRFLNLSAPLWAELYIDGGWLLLVLGMAGIGWAVRRGDLRAARERPGAGVLAWTLPFYLILVIRGSLLTSVAGLTVLTLCAFVVTRRTSRSVAGAAA